MGRRIGDRRESNGRRAETGRRAAREYWSIGSRAQFARGIRGFTSWEVRPILPDDSRWKGVEKFGLRIIYSSRERFKVGRREGARGDLKLLIARVNGSQMMYFYANFYVCFGI